MKLQKPSVYSRICLVRFMAITVPKHLPPQTTDFHIFTPCRIGFLSKIELFLIFVKHAHVKFSAFVHQNLEL